MDSRPPPMGGSLPMESRLQTFSFTSPILPHGSLGLAAVSLLPRPNFSRMPQGITGIPLGARGTRSGGDDSLPVLGTAGFLG